MPFIFLSEIEKRDPNIRLCLHYRHFIPGEFISDNITRAVKNSKRTVLILSRYAHQTFISYVISIFRSAKQYFIPSDTL